ncbi:hypothetical protein Bca52824_066156 [Brassica carinata]|uniref:mRNA (guanine-N(7))-methyltransferase n=1 Tax=Brassica carinata TaxID=52824 RepID=A0A8X7QJX4_BRACI|nr:hypothetical protein Bca52824_066156 [Brassica carinata]
MNPNGESPVSGDLISEKPSGKAVGGDLIKWDKARIGFYVGIDIAEGSIEDCRTRYNGDADQHQRRKKFSFPPVYYVGIVLSLLCNTSGLLRHVHDGLWQCLSSSSEVSLSEQCLTPMLSLNNSDKLIWFFVYIEYTAESLEIANSVYWIHFGEWFSQKKFKSSSPFGIKYVFHLEGGDLIKWDKARIGFYVGIDIAEGSIEDCRTRYNGDADQHQRNKKFSFPPVYYVGIVLSLLCNTSGLLRHVHDGLWQCLSSSSEVELDKIIEDDAPIVICSYQWTTEARARRALAITMPDANLIWFFVYIEYTAEGLEIANSVYWIRFGEWFSQKKFKSSSPFGIKYVFHLEDAVDCPEWIYDLELVFVKNSHEVVHEYMKNTEFVELMRRLGALGDGNQDQSTLSADECDAAYLYLSFVLRKVCFNREEENLMEVRGEEGGGRMGK